MSVLCLVVLWDLLYFSTLQSTDDKGCLTKTILLYLRFCVWIILVKMKIVNTENLEFEELLNIGKFKFGSCKWAILVFYWKTVGMAIWPLIIISLTTTEWKMQRISANKPIFLFTLEVSYTLLTFSDIFYVWLNFCLNLRQTFWSYRLVSTDL